MTPGEAFEAYCEFFAAGDGAAMAGLFTEDGVFEASSLDAPLRGRRRLESQLQIIANGATAIRTEIRLAIEDGERGHFEGVYEAEVVGTGGKLDGSAHRIDFKFVAMVEMRGGKIARLAEIFDTRPLHPEERQYVWAMNRRTPYWDGTVAAKCMEWSVYNNMYFPMIYSRMPFEDYRALLDGVTLWDVGLERQTQLRGPDAPAFLDYLCCRDMSGMRPGDCRYAQICDDHGMIMGDPVVLWPRADTLWISHGNTDITLWARGIAMGSDWEVEVSEPDVAPLQIQGPLALDVLQKICGADLAAMENYTCLETRVAGQAAVVSRTGWSGGFGFEVFPFTSARAMELWQAILDAGEEFDIKVTGPIVSRAVERGVTDTGYYNNCDMNPFEDLNARLVDLDKPADFVGKQALERIRREGIRRRSVGLVFDAAVPRLEWFWDATDPRGNPGHVRWAVYSFALERYIGIALVDRAVEIGETLRVEHPRGICTAEVAEVPFVGRDS
jgi:aminomethyltransferase